MLRLSQIRSFLTYWLDAVGEHSLHSPFFYDLYTKTIKSSAEEKSFEAIEKIRTKLLQDSATLEVEDMGAGALQYKAKRKISDIARRSVSNKKYSVLYSSLIKYFNAQLSIELGTSLGINTLYLAQYSKQVITFEGAKTIATLARKNFELMKCYNIQLIEGNLNYSLQNYLQNIQRFDFALIDANHRYTPTIEYFELLSKKTHSKAIIVMDDIHYSREMETAWVYCKNSPFVYASADLFRCGILFFDPSLNKQHVVLDF